MDESIRKTFSQELEGLEKSAIEMGELAAVTIGNAVKALVEGDVALAEKTIADDEEIDLMEGHIEARCMELLALQQPMARDLRFIASILRIISDIERLADHGTKISKKAITLTGMDPIKPFVDLPKMAASVTEMLRLSLKAFVDRDPELARKVIAMDDEIDEYNHKIFVDLVGYMTDDSKCVNYVSHLMVVVQSLERIGDHVTNICERIIYVTTGVLSKLN